MSPKKDQFGPPEPLETKDAQGRTWRRFCCSFKGSDGKYGFYIYALSQEHAELLLADLKETAVVDGEMIASRDDPDDFPDID